MASESRKRYLELMYIVLYVMSIKTEKVDLKKMGLEVTLSMINDLRRDIEISCEDIDSMAKSANEMELTFNNNEELKQISENIKDFYNTWMSYYKNSERKTEELIISAGGYNNNKSIKHPENTRSVNEFIKEKNIEIIKKYVEDISNKINECNFPKEDKIIQNILKSLKNFEICDDGTSDDIFLNSFNNKFNNKPLAELVHFLYSKEYSISLYAKMIIDRLIKAAELNSPTFDNFELIVIPKKETVIAGKNYEATVFLNAKDYVKIDGEEPIVKVNGTKVNTENYVANIVYPTSRDVKFDKDGKHEMTLKIEYFQKNPFSNKDIELEKDVKFTVINKNEIEGSIATTNILLKQCSNNFNIKNEDPELNNNITYSIEGGRIISVKNIDRYNTNLVVYPTADECKIIVKNNNEEIKSFVNNVTEPEMPTFDFLVNGNQIVDQMELYSDNISDITIDVLNDLTFESNYPLDSTNSIKDWVIELKDDYKKTFNTISITNNNTYNFSDSDKALIDSRCKYIYIRVNNVVRQHKDSETSNNIEEIPLIKPFEILARQIKVLHRPKNMPRRNR